MIKFAVLVVCAFTIDAAHANDPGYPTVGLLYNTAEAASLQYSCELVNQELHCDMTQVFVRKQLPESEVSKRSKELFDLYKAKPKPGECEALINAAQLYKDMLNDPSKLPAEAREEMRQMPKSRKDYDLKGLSLAVEACRTESSAAIAALRDHKLKEEAGTCRVGSNHWKEAFQRVPRYSKEQLPVWTTKSTPSGACGIVLLNRFELIKTAGGLPFWNYVARKAVTNPDGGLTGLLTGRKCKEVFDEATYTYGWRSRDIYLDCSTIKFSPF